MDTTIKTREVVHDIKTKDTSNHLTHFIKSATVQTKPQDFENKDEPSSVETNSANKVQRVLKKTSITSFERAKDFTKNKIKTKKEQAKSHPTKQLLMRMQYILNLRLILL